MPKEPSQKNGSTRIANAAAKKVNRGPIIKLLRAENKSSDGTFVFDVKKQQVECECHLKPTQVKKEDIWWLWARNNKYSDEIDPDTGGKWMLFYPPRQANEAWNKIKLGVQNGELWRAKISTTGSKPERHAVMIYTKDYTDKKDVTRVLNYLEAKKLKPRYIHIRYKTNAQTRAGIYAGGSEQPWIYSSETIRTITDEHPRPTATPPQSNSVSTPPIQRPPTQVEKLSQDEKTSTTTNAEKPKNGKGVSTQSKSVPVQTQTPIEIVRGKNLTSKKPSALQNGPSFFKAPSSVSSKMFPPDAQPREHKEASQKANTSMWIKKPVIAGNQTNKGNAPTNNTGAKKSHSTPSTFSKGRSGD